jgi:dienelactone hydrolase
VLVLVLVLVGCGGSGQTPPQKLPATLAHRFEYDRSAPVGLRDAGVVNHDYPVRIHEIAYRGPNGDQVGGYLMVPPGKGPFAGVVMVPGSGGSADTFLVEGADLAARGAVTLSIGTRFIAGEDLGDGVPALRAFRAGFTANVLDLRRALDVLQRRPDVDKHRLGLVGHSLGASLDAVVAGVDDRVAAVALIAPPRRPHFYPPLPAREEDRVLGSIDPTRYLPPARASILLALAKRDQVIPRAEYDAYIDAAPVGRTVRWYDTDHHMSRRSVEDALDWLAGQLGLGPLPPYARG